MPAPTSAPDHRARRRATAANGQRHGRSTATATGLAQGAHSANAGGDDATDIRDYLSYLLASAHRHMRLGLAQTIAAEDVTEEQWRILQVLSDEHGRAMGDLAVQVLMNHPALTKNIDKLVGRGLVQRAPDAQDSRRVLVYISDLGLDTVGRLRPRVDAHHGALEQALGVRKVEQLKKLLQAFIEESTPR